jgi:hypothetical protein
MVPTVTLPLGMAFTSQFTAGLLAFCTFALNCRVPPAETCVAGADTVTVMAGAAATGGSPPPPAEAAQEIKPSGASNIPKKQAARFPFAGARWRPREDVQTVSNSMESGHPGQIR